MLLEVGVIAATIALAVGASGVERRRRKTAIRTFEQYARSRSFTFVPPPARPKGAGPRVEGKAEDVAFAFDLYRVGGDLRTRITAFAPKGVAPRISIVQRGVVTRTVGKTSAPTGHVAFDRVFETTGATDDDRDRLRETVVPSMLLLAHRERVSLVSSGEKVTLSWSGVEPNPVLLDAARDAAVAVARWHRPDAPYR